MAEGLLGRGWAGDGISEGEAGEGGRLGKGLGGDWDGSRAGKGVWDRDGMGEGRLGEEG